MVCPYCGAETGGAGGACASCGRALAHPGSMAVTTLTPPPDITQHTTAGGSTVAPLRSEGPLAIGQRFGSRFRILKVLGAGGMGVVYQAWDEALDLPVALKVIRPEVVADVTVAREVEGRFKRELVLARQVTHRNVVRIHDFGEIDGIKYISMPFIEGRSLAAILAETGRLPCARALQIVRQIAEGLKAAHDAGVIHRDLKPENVMVDAEGRAVIMDFGISRSAEGGTTIGLTAAGSVIGTVQYMAPEQAMGEPVDQRADVYALGLIAYDLIAGCQRLANMTTPVSEMMHRVQHAPAPLRTKAADAPPEIERIIARALEPEPAKRYQNVGELIADLDAFTSGAASRGLGRLARAPWAAIASAVLIIVAAVGGASWWLSRARVPASAAPHETISVLVADFDNRAADPVFDGTLENALTIAMEGASFVTSFQRAVAQGLNAQLRPGHKLDEEGARLVSQREGVSVVLAGSIAREGTGYIVEVRAIDPFPGKPLVTARADARDKSQVLDAVSRVAAQVRHGLGDTSIESGRIAATDTFTAASLEAAREYSLGQELSQQNKYDDAIGHYQRALQYDPEFGRAYSGWAIAAALLGRTQESAELFKQALSRLDRMSEREKLRTLGLYYSRAARDPDKAIESFTALLQKYPSDTIGLNNLAVAYFNALNFQKALDYGRKSVEIYPRNVLIRYNYALYAMYAGNFAEARTHATEVLKLNPDTPKAYLALAMAAAAEGRRDEAARVYERAAASGARGASIAAAGLADLQMFDGRFADAEGVLTKAIARDQELKNTSGAAAKLVALAQAQQAQGHTADALKSVGAALKLSSLDSIAVPAAIFFAQYGRTRDAQAIAARLGGQFVPRARAYGKLIEGLTALSAKRTPDAIESLRLAHNLAELWVIHYWLGVAYVEAGAHAEALSEFESCEKGRGQATAVFLDDVPTWRYTVPVSYWLARAQEGVGVKEQAAANYKKYLSLRQPASDSFAADAERRLAALR